MALSLDKATRKTKKATDSKQAGRSRKSVAPWSQSGLAKVGRSRKQTTSEAHINDEWIHLHEAPLFWVDLAADSRLQVIQEKLCKIEDQCLRVLNWQRAFFGKICELVLPRAKT